MSDDAFNGEDPEEEVEVDRTMVRSFLNRIKPLPVQEASRSNDAGDAATVRSYAITGGRSTAVVPLEYESMMQTTPQGMSDMKSLNFERGAIATLCRSEILSVAELSARLHLPIGVVRVIAADLVSEGILEAFMSNLSVADDISLISRLIEGVRAL